MTTDPIGSALDPALLARLEDLAEKATPGPWEAQRQEAVTDADRWELLGNPPHISRFMGVLSTVHHDNAATARLIAEMRNALPALLAAARRATALEAETARLRAALALFQPGPDWAVLGVTRPTAGYWPSCIFREPHETTEQAMARRARYLDDAPRETVWVDAEAAQLAPPEGAGSGE